MYTTCLARAGTRGRAACDGQPTFHLFVLCCLCSPFHLYTMGIPTFPRCAVHVSSSCSAPRGHPLMPTALLHAGQVYSSHTSSLLCFLAEFAVLVMLPQFAALVACAANGIHGPTNPVIVIEILVMLVMAFGREPGVSTMRRTRGEETERDPKAGRPGVTIGHHRAKDNPKEVPDAKLQRVRIHTCHCGRGFEAMVEFVDQLVQVFDVNQAVCPVEPKVDDSGVCQHFARLCLPLPYVRVLRLDPGGVWE